MKQIFTLLMILGLFNCKHSKNNFSETELQLLKKIDFEKEILINLKKHVKGEFKQYETSDPGYIIGEDGEPQKTGVEKKNGISFKIPENKAIEIVLENQKYLLNQGYLVFISENGYQAPSTVSVIKSKDQFDILKIQKTNGINYEIENEDVVKKLKEWDKKFGIQILGADYDWVDFTINVPNDNIPDFAKEVYEFCPDAIDQGVGEIENLEKVIADNRIFLWWD